MDNRFIFLYHLYNRCNDEEGYTEPIIGFRSKHKGVHIGKSVCSVAEVWAKIVAILLKSVDAKLPRKAARVNYIGARTQNRHRWARRVS